MSEDILDAGYKKRKPVSVVKTSVLSGVAGFLAFSLIRLVNYLAGSGAIEPINYSQLMLSLFVIVAFFGPTLISMLLIAAWGERQRHYWRILLAGQLAFFISISSIIILTYSIHLYTESSWKYMDIDVFLAFVLVNALIFPAAFIFWLIPGKLSYFRKQMEL